MILSILDASKVLRALRDVLERDGVLAQAIVKDAGISLRDVRMAPDNSKAFILWDTYKENVQNSEEILRENTGKLKHLVSKQLKSKKAPFLEFIGYHERSVQQSEQEYTLLMKKIDGIVTTK